MPGEAMKTENAASPAPHHAIVTGLIIFVKMSKKECFAVDIHDDLTIIGVEASD